MYLVIREIIDHGKNGWLCGTDDESISRAIQHLLSRPELCSSLGQNAHKYVIKHFPLNEIFSRELETIMRVAGK